jgi:hypothetical protein
MRPPRALPAAHFERNDVTIICETVHYRRSPGRSSLFTLTYRDYEDYQPGQARLQPTLTKPHETA